MTEGGYQIRASLRASVISHLIRENFVGNKDAGGRKKVAHPGHREPNVGHRTRDGGGPLGHRRPCKLWQVPEKERYVHKQAQVKVLESSGPNLHLPL